MPIPVTCRCGQKFRAKDALAGKRVKCPKCGGALAIPLPQPPAVEVDLADAASYEADAFAQPAPGPLGTPSPQGGAGSPLASSPLGQPQQGWGTPAGWQGQALGQQTPRKQSQGLSLTLIIALAGGGGALILVVVIAIVAVVFITKTDVQLVEQPPSIADAEKTTPEGAVADAGTSAVATTTPAERTTFPEKSKTISQPTTPHKSAQESSDGETHGQTADVDDLVDLSRQDLAAAAIQWHSQPGARLRGALPLKDQDMVIFQYSWLTQLLPYLGHQQLYESLDLSRPWTRDPNLTHARTVIPQFLNPADDRKSWEGLAYYGMGLTHFVGMSGVEDGRNVVAAELPRTDPRAGVFGYHQVASHQEITDGTSQTMMIIGSGELANPWVQAGGATVRGAREPYFDKITGFGSRGLSREGAFAVMVDGSIRFVSAEIDPSTFRAMCTIHGNDAVDMSNVGPQLDRFSLR